MPGTMFTEVVSPRESSSRKWYTVPLSLIVHAAIFAVIIVVPLVATGELPMPARLMPSYVIADVVPSPPPVAPQPRRSPTQATAVNPHVAPLEAPPTIGAENGIVIDQGLIQTNGVDGLVEGLGRSGVGVEQPPPLTIAPPEPIRAGGAIRPPTRIKDVAPTYPTIARMNKVQGVVIIEAIIGTDGKVENARVIRSTPLLDEAALEAVRAWEYSPTLLNGRPTPVIMTVTVHFKLGN
jgi:TonB family protein